MNPLSASRAVSFLILFALIAAPTSAVTRRKNPRKGGSPTHSRRQRVVRGAHRPAKGQLFVNPWKVPTFADSTSGDSLEGEEMAVRSAAVRALGPYNGSVIVADFGTGRILTIVNQKLAFQSGFTPCSTIKIVAALAGLEEGILQNQDSPIPVTRHRAINLTQALAHSNNQFFATVGLRLGYKKIVEYAHMFGLDETAGLNLEGEQRGWVASEPPAVGLGMMTSYGEGIRMTPLGLTALMVAVANGGTLYYLQHPRSQQETSHFVPRVKRQLDVGVWLREIKPGLIGAVQFGTARRANVNPTGRIFGKTGTCTDSQSPTHLGWFGSYSESEGNKLVIVVLLTGGQGISGPIASGVAGSVYRNLWRNSNFVKSNLTSPIALIPAGRN